MAAARVDGQDARPPSASADGGAAAGVAGCALGAVVLLLAGPLAPTPVFRAPAAQAADIVTGVSSSMAVSPLSPPAVAGMHARAGLTGIEGRPVYPVARKRGSRTIVTRPLPSMPIIPPYRPPPSQGEVPAPAGALPLDAESLTTPGDDAAI